jgi:hypothetical protein
MPNGFCLKAGEEAITILEIAFCSYVVTESVQFLLIQKFVLFIVSVQKKQPFRE